MSRKTRSSKPRLMDSDTLRFLDATFDALKRNEGRDLDGLEMLDVWQGVMKELPYNKHYKLTTNESIEKGREYEELKKVSATLIDAKSILDVLASSLAEKIEVLKARAHGLSQTMHGRQGHGIASLSDEILSIFIEFCVNPHLPCTQALALSHTSQDASVESQSRRLPSGPTSYTNFLTLTSRDYTYNVAGERGST
ncbi:hypothetical protein SCHPADRAFT_982063 [Schizopora paradoxa]|uniref:Uncharacterized protein n=1 Tax=Schizopora paradoxa TaxID=27342 RepID=A0A0H2RAR9_9AGAM|nr:hypothetical protein SCHPADRAFT_982063 [Schizopora paradoxa]